MVGDPMLTNGSGCGWLTDNWYISTVSSAKESSLIVKGAIGSDLLPLAVNVTTLLTLAPEVTTVLGWLPGPTKHNVF